MNNDLVIIGGGVAGLTAAMFAARRDLAVAVVNPGGGGGQIVNADRIENLPGFPAGLAGFEVGPLLEEQAESAGASFVFDTATTLEVDGTARIVHCQEEMLWAQAVIVAAGSSFRAIGIPGEAEFTRRGVSHCATCDGQFFAGQPVCVVGGGDSAFDEALFLARVASRVTIVHRGPAPQAQQSLVDRVSALSNVEIVPDQEVTAIVGDGLVTGVELRDAAGRPSSLPVAGVFIYVGLEPNTAFLAGVVDLDPAGHIVTDLAMRTSVPGIFAAGDIRTQSVAQLAAAAGDGATAAISAHAYLNGLKNAAR